MHLQIHPKSSISPQALMTVFGVLAGLSLTIGLVFWAMGAFFVLPFAQMETLLLAVTFLYHAIFVTAPPRSDQKGRLRLFARYGLGAEKLAQDIQVLISQRK